MEIHIHIRDDGSLELLALDHCEDLLHDYRYFISAAKNDAKNVFLHKRFLRVSLLSLTAYANAVLNGWIYTILANRGEVPLFEKLERNCLAKRIQWLSREARMPAKLHKVENANRIRNKVAHFTPFLDEDQQLFENLNLEAIENTERELALWMSEIEKVLGLERPTCHEALEEFTSDLPFRTTKHICSDE